MLDRLLLRAHGLVAPVLAGMRKATPPPVRAALKIALILAVMGVVAWRVAEIGWRDVAAVLPATPWFYALTIVIFIALPAAEAVGYGLLAGGPIRDGVRVFARKRVFNESVLSYSGEAFLYGRLVASGRFDGESALIAVKDHNLVSALLSNTLTVVLAFSLVLSGASAIFAAAWSAAPIAVAAGGAILAALYLASLVFFPKLTKLRPPVLAALIGVQGARLAVVVFLQTLQWRIGAPETTFLTWLSFYAVLLLIKRLPFLPNADLIFLGVGVGLSGFGGDAENVVAATLLASAASMQVMQGLAFLATFGAGGRGSQRASTKRRSASTDAAS